MMETLSPMMDALTVRRTHFGLALEVQRLPQMSANFVETVRGRLAKLVMMEIQLLEMVALQFAQLKQGGLVMGPYLMLVVNAETALENQ